MRFQISETIYTADAQRVGRLLETCLRELTADATVSHDEIVLQGLGPSPVSINRHDKAVFRIRSEVDKTIIDGDITFQASSMLGDLAQDDVVRSKLEDAFAKLRMQINSEPEMPAALAENAHAALVRAATSDENAKPAPEPSVNNRADEDGVRQTLEPLTLPACLPENSPEFCSVEADEPSTSGAKRTNVWISAIALLLILIGTGLFYLRGRTVDPFFALSTSRSPSTSVISGAKPEKMPAKENSAVNNKQAAAFETSGDLTTWIDSWAAAMRSRDVAAQSSFYANTGSEYSGRQDLDRESILKNLEADIRMRKGLWTEKMEDVTIERHTSTQAEIRLVKHVIEEPSPHTILESFVPARLILERENGAWKIFSEQDSPPSSRNPERSK